MLNWYDFFNLDEKVISDIQTKIQTVDAMTTTQIKEFMGRASSVITDNMAKTGLVDFIDPDGEIMKWRINTTTDIEERLLDAFETIQFDNLKIRCEREIPTHLRDILYKNMIAFLVDVFVGIPCAKTQSIQSIQNRVNRLTNNLSELLSREPTVPLRPLPHESSGVAGGSQGGRQPPCVIPEPTIAKMREYINLFLNATVIQYNITKCISDELKPKFEKYIDGASDELSNVNSEYIDDAIYKYYTAYMSRTRETLMTAFECIGYDKSKISVYYAEVEPRDIFDTVPPSSGTLNVSLQRYNGILEVVRIENRIMIREETIEYSYDNSLWGNRLLRSLANIKYNLVQGNENAIALLAFAIASFIDIPDTFEPVGFVLLNDSADTLEEFTIKYERFVAMTKETPIYGNPNIVSYTDDTIGIIEIPKTNIPEFQYELYKKTNGYIYLYKWVSHKSTISEYLSGLTEIDVNITSENIFKFGLQNGSAIADLIVGISRTVDKTALTISSVAKLGVQVVSPIGLPLVYAMALGEFILRELWWKLGVDDLSTTFQVPPPFGAVISVLYPIYSVAATAQYPVLASLQKIGIIGTQLSQFISKCIRDGLYVRLLNDSNVRFLGVNFLMTPVYSSTGIIEGTQMKRILDDKSYARLLALQVMNLRFQECEMEINAFVEKMNTDTSLFHLKQTIQDEISRKISPEIIKRINNNINVVRTDNYNNIQQKIITPIKIPLNSVDLQFYERCSISDLREQTIGIMRDYEINVEISELDINKAVQNIRKQYEYLDTFQTYIYMTNTEATTKNGYFLRGVEMTDNGILKQIQMEIDNSINTSVFFS